MNKENYKLVGLSIEIPVVLGLLTVLLGYVSFDLVFPDYPFLRKLYYSFQLFSLESGDRYYVDGKTFHWTTELIYNAARFFALFTLIYTIVLALLALLRNKLNLTRVRFMKGHTILCGLGEVGNAIAHNFVKKNKLVIIENNTGNANIEQLRRQGVKIIEANALDPEVLRQVGLANSACFYALTGDDFTNLSILRQVRAILENGSKRKPNAQLAANVDSTNLKLAGYQEMSGKNAGGVAPLQHTLHSLRECAEKVIAFPENPLHLKDYEEIRNFLSTCGSDKTVAGLVTEKDVKLFNINELASRYIFHHYPPDRFRPVTSREDPPVHILFIGYSRIGEELFKQCAQNCHFINGKKTKISILSLDADLAKERIEAKFKNITELINTRFIRFNPHHITPATLEENGLNDVDVIYICSDNDRLQTSYTARVQVVFGKAIPIVRWFSNDFTKGNAERESDNIFTTDILCSVASHENVINEALDRKAIAVHSLWLKRAISGYIKSVDKSILLKEPVPLPKPTMVPWQYLDEEIRDDNRSVIEHSFIKIRATGQVGDFLTYLNQQNRPDFSFLNNPDLVAPLAEMEHRRWMAAKYLYGWRFDEVRDDKRLRHNNLVDFDDLDEGTRDYDTNQVKELEIIWNL